MYRLNLFFVSSPWLVLQFRLLAWTVAIELIYPLPLAPLSIFTLAENLYKLQIWSWHFPAKNYFPREWRSNSTIHDVKPFQVWLLLVHAQSSSCSLLPMPHYGHHSCLQFAQHAGAGAQPFLYLESPSSFVGLDKIPLSYCPSLRPSQGSQAKPHPLLHPSTGPSISFHVLSQIAFCDVVIFKAMFIFFFLLKRAE